MTFLYQKKIIPANSYTKQNDFMKSIHQIFYSCNKFDNATQLENLNKYMLTSQSYLVLKNLVKKRTRCGNYKRQSRKPSYIYY
jgi:hypothetical protein